MAHPRLSKHEMFNAAAEIQDAAERAAFLDRECAGDAALRAEIEELLRHDAEAGSFLGGSAPAPAEAPLESPGTVIGPYKLLEQIGEGGFGVVFMAEQSVPVRRKVALKVLKPGMDTRQVIARFEAERQALALMDHPGIARVFDAGTTATGRPYFVMELVRGVPITEYCDANRLSPRERLELFVTVCHAVQHAHQKGVIHRDLKPSNVLVTLHDDRPVAKVIDFGIAKATGERLTEKTVFTGFAQMIGTPLYMSPEQASMNALDVDTRSDIYSLGVLLYELLTGATPFEKARMKEAAFDEIRRIIREEEPATPSARLSTSDALPTLAANRGMEPAKLTRLVRGELDWIVMKALEKDRTRRYETANGLAVDVQRYLADEPVSACPPSIGYRVKKLVRRNRRALVVASLLGAMLLALAGSLGWMARDVASRRARTLEMVGALLDQCEEALRADDPDRAADMLGVAERRASEGGAGELEGRLARCRADLELLRDLDAIDTLRWTWTEGGYAEAETLAARWRAALAGYGVNLDEDRAEEAAARVNASLVRDRVLTALDLMLAGRAICGTIGRPKGTEEVRRIEEPRPKGWAEVRAVLRAADPDPYRDAVRDAIAPRDATLADLVARPDALAQPARFAAVLGALRSVPLDRRRAVLERALWGDPKDMNLLLGLAFSYMSAPSYGPRRETGGALRWLQAAVAVYPKNVAALTNLGSILSESGDVEGAVACFETVLRIDPTFAIALNDMGVALQRRGEIEKAIAYYREAIRHSADYELVYVNLANALLANGELDEAGAMLQRAITLDPRAAAAYMSLGDVAWARQDAETALGHYKKAIDLDPEFPIPHYDMGNVFFAKGNNEEAIACFRRAIDLDPEYAEAHGNLGYAYAKQGEREKAIACYEKAIQCEPTLATAHYNLGIVLEKREPDRALRCYREAIRLDPTNAQLRFYVGCGFRDMGQLDDAIDCYREAIRLESNRSKPSGGIPLAGMHLSLGNALRKKGDTGGAIACYQEALRLDRTFAWAHHALGCALEDKGEPDEAIVCYRNAIRFDPNLAVAHLNLGSLLHTKRLLDDAIACYKRALELDPNSALAQCDLGAALVDRGDRVSGIPYLRAAIRLDPGYAMAYSNLGNALVDEGAPDEGFACLRKALELDPKYAAGYNNLGHALKLYGRLDEAIACLRRAVELDPNEPHYWNNLGSGLCQKGDPDGAIPCYEAAIRLMPTYADPYKGIGNARVMKGRPEDAIEWYRQASELEPNLKGLHYDWGIALVRKRDLVGAVAEYRKAIEADPGHAEAYCNLGKVLEALGRFQEALEYLQKGHDLGRRQPRWPYPSDAWVRDAERKCALETRLPQVLAGEAAGPDELVSLADLCLRFKKRNADAALLYGKALAADPRLNGHRYNAACAAALAAAGQGAGAETLDSSERTRLRGMAFDWLSAELLACGSLPAGDPEVVARVHGQLRHWLEDPDLRAVRDAEALSGLPDEERWTKLWSDVRNLVARRAKE